MKKIFLLMMVLGSTLAFAKQPLAIYDQESGEATCTNVSNAVQGQQVGTDGKPISGGGSDNSGT